MFIGCRRNDIALDPHRILHRSDPGRALLDHGARLDLSYGLPKAGDPNRFLRGANSFEDGETLGFDFRWRFPA